MFDYLDEILNLQSAGNLLIHYLSRTSYFLGVNLFLLFSVQVFGSLDMSRANSMTSAGQCRLAPLIPCIQDSSQLYDYSVKVLFKLHGGWFICPLIYFWCLLFFLINPYSSTTQIFICC